MSATHFLEEIITKAYEANSSDKETAQAVFETLELLDKGQIRVCEKVSQTWQTNAWIKKAVLLYFRFAEQKEESFGPFTYHDKIPLKGNFKKSKVRVVPPACARYGSFLEEGVILMPSYVNIGARVGARTMIDTWATVGSCAQVGQDVHISGGVGIGGVLEPPSATPVIIEDGAFIGSRCILVEGVHIGKEAVLAANVTLTASTPIIDTREKEFKRSKGYIPERCVVLSGVEEKNINGGKIYTSCAYIVGERKPSTDLKTSLNQALRDFSVSV